MADITQSLGFDVSAAISNLNSLNAAIQNHNQVLTGLRATYNAFNIATPFQAIITSLNNLNAATNTAANSIVNAANRASQAANQFGQAGGQVTALSSALNTLTGRVIFANLVSRGATQVRQAFAEAVTDAVEFQRGLSRIQTIAPALQGNLDKLADAVVNVSNEFNAPLGDSTEALYQVISNQVEGTAAQFDVLTTSMKLAKTTGSTTAQAVDLITASINGFNKNVQDADQIAASWFKTFDLGRIQADQVANSIGRLAKLASEVGVKMEEVEASLAAITISGVSPSEAITQVRATLTGLIKPSEALKEAIAELGYTSSQQAIEVLGFNGTLQGLFTLADGSAAKLGKLFPNVRNLAGVLNLASDGGDRFVNSLNEIKNFTDEQFGKAYQIVIETDAEKATKSLNKLKNFLTQEVGFAALRTFNQINDSVDNVSSTLESMGDALEATIGITPRLANLETVFVGIIAALPSATAAMIAYSVATRGAAFATTAFGSSAGGLIGALGALGTGLFAVLAGAQAYQSAIQNQLDQAYDNFQARIKEQIQSIKNANEDRVKLEESVWDKAINASRNGVAEQLTTYQKGNFAIRAESEATAEALGDAVTKVFEARKRAIDDLVSASIDAEKLVKDSIKESSAVRVKTEDTLFQRRLRNNNTQEQFNKLLQRSSQLGKQAAVALSTAKNSDKKAVADDLFSRATALEQQAFALASQTKDASAMQRAEAQLTRLTKDRTAALAEFANTQSRVAKDAEKLAQKQQDYVRDLQREFKDLGKGPQLFDSIGNVLPEDVRRENIRAFDEMFQKFEDRAINGGLDFGDFISLKTFQSDLNKKLSASEIDALRFGRDAFKNADSGLNKAVDDFLQNKEVKLLTDIVFRANGQVVTDPAQLFQQFQQVGENSLQANKLKSQIEQAQKEAQGARLGAINAIDASKNVGTISETIFSGKQAAKAVPEMFRNGWSRPVDVVTKPYTEAVNSIRIAIADSAVTFAEVETLLPKIQAAIDAFNSPKNTAESIQPTQIEALKAARTDLQKAAEAQNQVEKFQKELNGLNPSGLQQAFESTQQIFGDLEVKAQGLTNSLGLIAPTLNIGLSAVTNSFREWQSSANAILATTQRISAESAMSRVPTPSSGRVADNRASIFRASGGVARGQDNINAVLSKGEFVVNARNYRRFAPEVTAINAGVQPTYRSTGGVVNNTNVGDINITMSGSETPQGSARKLASELRRELRRGTSRI